MADHQESLLSAKQVILSSELTTALSSEKTVTAITAEKFLLNSLDAAQLLETPTVK